MRILLYLSEVNEEELLPLVLMLASRSRKRSRAVAAAPPVGETAPPPPVDARALPAQLHDMGRQLQEERDAARATHAAVLDAAVAWHEHSGGYAASDAQAQRLVQALNAYADARAAVDARLDALEVRLDILRHQTWSAVQAMHTSSLHNLMFPTQQSLYIGNNGGNNSGAGVVTPAPVAPAETAAQKRRPRRAPGATAPATAAKRRAAAPRRRSKTTATAAPASPSQH